MSLSNLKPYLNPTANIAPVYHSFLRHLVHLDSAHVFGKSLQANIKPEYSHKKARLALQERKSVFSIKLYVCAASYYNTGYSKTMASVYDIPEVDAMLVAKSLASDDNLRLAAKRLEDRSKLLTVKEYDTLYTQVVYPAALGYAKKLTYSKLRFISKFDNLQLDDLTAELLHKSVISYYKLMPDSSKSTAHIVNYVKRSIHNHAVNTIKFYTSQRRGRLKGNKETGYTLIASSQNQNQLLGVDADDDVLETAGIDTSEQFFLTSSVESVLKQYPANSTRYRILYILMGGLDYEFTQFLHYKKYCRKRETNIQLQERTTNQAFNFIVAQYFQISYRWLCRFLDYVGVNIAPEVHNGTSFSAY
jgi:hypothetical protein